MQKALKYLFGLLGTLIILCVAAVVALITLVNPNDFKGQLSQRVYQYTGRQLTLNGEMHWSFFPWLGLEVNQAQLSNLAGFGSEPFAQIQQADIKVELQPLLQRRIEVDKISLKGLELHLIVNAKGIANWQNLTVTNTSSATNNKVSTAQPVAATSSANNSWTTPTAFLIAGIDVTNGHVTYADQQKKQLFDVSQLQLSSQTIELGKAFPVNLSFVLQSADPLIKSSIALNADVMVNANKQFLVNGKATLDHMQLPVVTVHAITTNFNLQNSAKDSSQIVAQGNVVIDSVQLNKVKLSDIAAQYSYQNNIAKLTQIRAKLYQGNYNGNLTYVMSGKAPQIITDAQLSGIQVEPLYQDLTTMRRLQLVGTGNVNAHLTTAGSNADAMLARLSGNVQMNISNGAIKGIDIPHLISMGRALINRQVPSTQGGTNQTDFSKFSASATINNGVVNNNDLLLQSQYLQANGKGSVDIVKERIDYQLSAQPVHPDSGKPDGIAIPIAITGSFDNLSIRPDVNALLQSAVQQQIDKQKDNIKQRINVEIDKKLGNALGDQLKNQLNNLFGK